MNRNIILKNVKVTSVLFYFLFISQSLLAQCKYEKNGIDPFEKVEVVLTEEVKVMYPSWSFPVVWMALGRVDTTYFIQLRFSFSKPVCFNEESDLLLMTEGGEVVRLKKNSKSVECAEYKKKGSVSIYEGVLRYNIDKESLLKLSTKSFEKFRLYTTDSNIEVDLTTKNVNKNKGMSFFKDISSCVLKN